MIIPSTRTDRLPVIPSTRTDRLPVWRMGITGGLVGILCCVGPTVLALLGIVSAGTAFAWATDLYDNHAWWFRLGGIAVLALLIWWALRRRNQCNVAGARRWRWKLVAVLGIAVGTYVALYGLTTWLGTFA
jgi:chromate transport protein ChrA